MGGGKILKRTKRIFSVVVASLLTVFTLISNLPARTASAAVVVPKIQFASPPVTQYTAGDRVNFNINAPNYGGRVQYRVVLWNDSEKTYYDLWNAGNGYPEKYYTKWQPYGNNIFTLGWIIFDPGSYRITVYAKRAGISNSKTALKGFNCDSYMESVAFTVKSKEATVSSILPLSDVTVMQGETPTLPTKVKAAMSDGFEKEFGVTWGAVNTSNPGTFTIEGTVAGTTKKASIKVNVTAQTAINVYSVVSVSNYLVNVTLRDAISATPEASKFSIKSYNSNTTVPIQSVSLSTDKKTVALTTGYLATNSWYTLTVNNSSLNFIGNQGTTGGISLAAQNKEVAVNGTVYATVTKSPSDVTLTYYSSNTTIATVNQTTGLITGKYPGTATITVYGNKSGYTQVSTTFTVVVGGQTGMYAYATDMEIGVGTQQMPTITKYPYDMTLYFTSSNPYVATVNSNTGLVTGVSQGTSTITITAYYNGYNTVTSTFIVTVRNQGITISATPTVLYESASNDGSLTSGVIDVYLTGSTFVTWSGYDYYESYVDVDNLPYGMSYTVAYVNSTRLRVTITGRAYSHRNADDENIRIIVDKDLVYGGTYDLTSNNVLINFSDNVSVPAAPTGPVVDDIANTFDWTNVSGYTSYSYYEYSVDNGSTWRSCTGKPQFVGDNAYPTSYVQVRVKASGSIPAGQVLRSDKAFTKGTVADTIAPALGMTMSMKFKGDALSYIYLYSDNDDAYIASIEKDKEITEMVVNATDTYLNTQDVPVKLQGTTLGVFKYTQNGAWKFNPSSPIKITEPITLTADFKDLTGNTTRATIKITVGLRISDIAEMTGTVVQGQVYPMPAQVDAIMSDGSTKKVNVTWEPASIDTSTTGDKIALGTVAGYTPKVKLTVTVTPAATIVRIADLADNVEEGTPYIMPRQVLAVMSDGQQKLVDVTWVPPTINTGIPGIYYILGTVAGYTPKVKLTVTVTAITIIKIDDLTKWAKLGQPFAMPTQVEAQMSNGTKRNVNVTWDPAAIDTGVPGIYYAFGTVAGYTPKVKLTVIVSETQPTGK